MTQPTAKLNLPILVAGLLLVVPLVAVLASGFGNDPHARPSALVGTRGNDVQLVDLDGNPVTLEQFAGKPVVLNFWSTWCGPCKMEHPLLVQAARSNPDVQFLGVLYSDDANKARSYLARAGTSYPQLLDPQNRAAIDYGVTGVPETFFLRADRTIVHKENGPVSPGLLQDKLAEARR